MNFTKQLITIVFIAVSTLLFTCESSTSEKSEAMKDKRVMVNTKGMTEKEIIALKEKMEKENTAVELGTEKMTFAKNSECKECHPVIFDEYSESSHQKSTIYNDAIHAAVWDLHPMNVKFEQYACGKCHTPAADNIAAFMNEGEHGMPDANSLTQEEGISCAVCHRIQSVKQHTASNTVAFSKKEKTYFGSRPNPQESDFHEIITNNYSFNKVDVCLGCHSHNLNKAEFPICNINMKISDQKTGDNCTNCHMPQVKGDVSTEKVTDTHAFHGFSGTNHHQEMLEKYVAFHFGKSKTGFIVRVQNNTPHALFMQPLRLGKLKVKVTRGGKVIQKFDDQIFVKALGDKGKPTFPWLATEIVKNTMLEGGKMVTFDFDYPAKKGDKVELTLGYHLVNPKAAPKLKLQDNKDATEFKVLKTQTFTI